MRVIAEGLQFPEGPVAMPDGSILVSEIAGGRISRISPGDGTTVVAELGGGPNGAALGPDGALYVCNNGGLNFSNVEGRLLAQHGLPSNYVGGSIQRVDLASGAVKTLYTHCGDVQLRGPNDIVFDKYGGFYFTDFGKNMGRVRDVGSVFYASIDGKTIREVIHPIANPNGVGLSPDQTLLYVAETETSRLWSYPIKAPGVLDQLGAPSPNGGTLVHGLGGYQRFDSMAVEQTGNVCVATLVTGHVSVFSPEGRLVEQVKLPDPHTTNLCFGGDDLKTAFVTQSTTGKLIAVDWPRAGLALNF
ncbi:SMP-30/gluconolactonase/LRE family protein [Bradyrhizobium sp.]|uniref:SMP-30/gluconolactonase/LRE family protein n=1 Tax=Bradyrhizobium sp. TaxID=376 RepID=UPI0039E5535F